MISIIRNSLEKTHSELLKAPFKQCFVDARILQNEKDNT